MTTGNVVDVLHLAKLCDAPGLYLKCVKLVTNNFEAVKETEGWKLLHKHDPWLEVDIIRLNKEQESVNNNHFIKIQQLCFIYIFLK